MCIMNPVTNDLEQLRGEVERLVYSSEESGFTICRLVVPGRGDLVTVAGTMPEFSRESGCTCEAGG